MRDQEKGRLSGRKIKNGQARKKVEREIKRNQWKRSTMLRGRLKEINGKDQQGSLKKMNNIETLGEKSRVRICEEEEKGKNQERAENEETDQKRDGEAMRDIKKGDMMKKGGKNIE